MEESRQRELAEFARSGIDAYNRGDIQALLEQLDQEIEVEMRIAQLYEVHDDKAARLHYYLDTETALAAAKRLSREAGHSA